MNTPNVAPTLPKLALPVAFSVPETLTPVPVITMILALPALLNVMLPLFKTFTFEVPFVNPEVLILAKERLPEPSV